MSDYQFFVIISTIFFASLFVLQQDKTWLFGLGTGWALMALVSCVTQ